jgi:transcription elongation factor GreA
LVDSSLLAAPQDDATSSTQQFRPGAAHTPPTHDRRTDARLEEIRMIWLTQQTFDRLQAELEDRRGPRRAEIVERISAARDEGDLKENGGYHAAKDEQGTNEARIRQLEEQLKDATTEPSADDHTVTAGKLVTYRFAGDDEESFLLGAREIADDRDDIEVYSPQSPLGAALEGHKAGETVDFEQPNGKVAKIEIISAVPFTD